MAAIGAAIAHAQGQWYIAPAKGVLAAAHAATSAHAARNGRAGQTGARTCTVTTDAILRARGRGLLEDTRPSIARTTAPVWTTPRPRRRRGGRARVVVPGHSAKGPNMMVLPSRPPYLQEVASHYIGGNMQTIRRGGLDSKNGNDGG